MMMRTEGCALVTAANNNVLNIETSLFSRAAIDARFLALRRSTFQTDRAPAVEIARILAAVEKCRPSAIGGIVCQERNSDYLRLISWRLCHARIRGIGEQILHVVIVHVHTRDADGGTLSGQSQSLDCKVTHRYVQRMSLGHRLRSAVQSRQIGVNKLSYATESRATWGAEVPSSA